MRPTADPRKPVGTARECIDEDAIYDLIVWNAPDHEHTRIQLRGVLEEIIAEQYDLYLTMGGDAAQGLTVRS